MRKNGFDRDVGTKEAPRLSEYNFSINASGSSENIIQSTVVEQLGLQDQIVPATRVLNVFNMASETTKGEIILPVNVAGTIEGDMRYNPLLRRPWIHNMRAVPSTLHQVLKFPTSEGIKTMCGEQPAAKEMFAIDEVIPVSVLSSTTI
uniref:Uncharacterized protein LOC104216165 n=1 Tax=Nicotiana sylvestris TaxID=4096 RepID=A0A1U7VQ46_NICSY|nr:PREDICTED: uncharacterized protein LOC104216165 [Nicotiana sylvestris]